MVSCLNCGRTWVDNKHGRNNLAKHKFRNTASDGTMSCISKEKKDEKRDEKRKASEMIKKIDPTAIVAAVEIVDAVNATTKINELLRENMELKDKLHANDEFHKLMMKENMELKDKLDKINEDYLKEFANDEIQKLKSRIKELESYIEERKDITSKADDVIRNCKCKMFRPYRDELKN
jgi:hypothetical protein